MCFLMNVSSLLLKRLTHTRECKIKYKVINFKMLSVEVIPSKIAVVV